MDVEGLTPEERERWEQLDPDQRAFVTQREPLWRRAHQIAARNSGVDVGDIYHVLVSLQETPTQRLARSFRRGRPEPGERAFLQALDELEIPCVVIGVGAAVLQGAPLVTQDLDLWCEDRTTPHGLDAFTVEYGRSLVLDLDGVSVRVLPLDRIIASKRAAGRPKDLAVIPALEAALAVQRDSGD